MTTTDEFDAWIEKRNGHVTAPPPAPQPTTYLATYPDGSQDLVTVWPGGKAEIAARRNQSATWGIPTEMTVTA